MEDKPAGLSSLIGSRICHDLISPIGAITNGLELLDMAGATSGPELSLIGDSVGNAAARIRFFRLAFGFAGAEEVSAADVIAVLADLQKGSRLRVDWRVSGPAPRQEVRLAFLGLMCLETAMPYGGDVVLRRDEGIWRLSGKAPRLQINDALWSDLTADTTSVAITPATVQFALLRDGVPEAGRRLTAQLRDSEVRIAF